MIPRIIHYCWFGGKPLPELERKCLASWKKFCPDYEIVRWDESNFDVNCCDYVREAYEAGKWAFVSDYARLKALVDNGGVYLDTDMELLKPIDVFMSNEAFAGLENDNSVSCGIMACEKGFVPFADIIDDYHNRHFCIQGRHDTTTIVRTVTKYFSQYGFTPDGKKQTVKGYTLYPKDYFYPMDHITYTLDITPDTYTIHHFAASWVSPYKRLKIRIRKLAGPKITLAVVGFKQFLRRKLGRPEK